LQRIANLTDNMAVLNLQGNIYKANDIIGNNNSLTEIGYKIWQDGTSEPVNYTAITPAPTPDANGNISVEDLEISNIEFTSVYNYKIAIADNYGYDDEILNGRVSTGISLWSEYEDKVDFYRPTRYKKEIFPNEFLDNEDEIVIGKWVDSSDIYRKVFTGTSSGTQTDITTNITSLNEVIAIYGSCNVDGGQIKPIPTAEGTYYINAFIMNNGGTLRIMNTDSGYMRGNYRIVVEYTKTMASV